MLESLSISTRLLPDYRIDGQSIITKKCFQGNGFTPEIYYNTLLLCNQTIYNVTFDEVSDGIYSFISLINQNDNRFPLSDRLYILSEIVSSRNDIDLISDIQTSIKEYSNIIDTSNYSLLHGDLHPGNIVFDHGIKLIDWEYSRFGLIELEIAYFSIMSSFTQIKFCNDYINKSVSFLENHYSIVSVELYLNVFLPLLLCSIYYYKSIGFVTNPNITPENYTHIFNVLNGK